MSRLCIATALILTTMGPMSAYAQTKPTLQIIIEEIGEPAEKCGVNKQTLRAPAVLTLRNNGISVSDAGTEPHLYIQAIMLAVNNMCTWSLSIQIRDYESATMRGRFKKNRAELSGLEAILMCSETSLGVSTKNGVVKQLSDFVEQSLKLCLSKVDY